MLAKDVPRLRPELVLKVSLFNTKRTESTDASFSVKVSVTFFWDEGQWEPGMGWGVQTRCALFLFTHCPDP